MAESDLPAVTASATTGPVTGETPEDWRDTNVRIEGPVVKFLQATFAESRLETTGTAIGGESYFPRVDPVGNITGRSSRVRRAAAAFKIMLLLLSINSAKNRF